MASELLFPENATKDERQINWQKIAKITDRDFGFDMPKVKNDKIRFNVRLLIPKDNGLICVVKSEKHGYMQLPGGGIEANEGIIDALRRETQEETGFLIKDMEPIGYTIERREDIRNIYDWGQAISFVFSALPEGEVDTNYTEGEKADSLRPIWIKLEDFIAKQERNKGKNYNDCFSTKRDLEIAKYFKSHRKELGLI